jgi:hypothetical protein
MSPAVSMPPPGAKHLGDQTPRAWYEKVKPQRAPNPPRARATSTAPTQHKRGGYLGTVLLPATEPHGFYLRARYRNVMPNARVAEYVEVGSGSLALLSQGSLRWDDSAKSKLVAIKTEAVDGYAARTLVGRCTAALGRALSLPFVFFLFRCRHNILFRISERKVMEAGERPRSPAPVGRPHSPVPLSVRAGTLTRASAAKAELATTNRQRVLQVQAEQIIRQAERTARLDERRQRCIEGATRSRAAAVRGVEAQADELRYGNAAAAVEFRTQRLVHAAKHAEVEREYMEQQKQRMADAVEQRAWPRCYPTQLKFAPDLTSFFVHPSSPYVPACAGLASRRAREDCAARKLREANEQTNRKLHICASAAIEERDLLVVRQEKACAQRVQRKVSVRSALEGCRAERAREVARMHEAQLSSKAASDAAQQKARSRVLAKTQNSGSSSARLKEEMQRKKEKAQQQVREQSRRHAERGIEAHTAEQERRQLLHDKILISRYVDLS